MSKYELAENRYNIVWIEDDINIIHDVIEPIEKANYKVHKFYSPKDALLKLDLLLKSDLLLVDMITDPVDNSTESQYPGKDFIKILKKMPDFNVPIVVLSIARSEGLIKKLKDLNVTEILQKPILPSELKACIDEIVKKNA